MSLERTDILAALRDTGATVTDRQTVGGSITKAARKLGVSRRTLQARMRFYRIAKGKAGRRKRTISYKRRTKNYAIGAAAIAATVGAVALYRRKLSSA